MPSLYILSHPYTSFPAYPILYLHILSHLIPSLLILYLPYTSHPYTSHPITTHFILSYPILSHPYTSHLIPNHSLHSIPFHQIIFLSYYSSHLILFLSSYSILSHSFPSHPIPSSAGMVKDREIVIQGHLAAEVEKYITMTYEIPSHLLHSRLMKGVKPKKT